MQRKTPHSMTSFINVDASSTPGPQLTYYSGPDNTALWTFVNDSSSYNGTLAVVEAPGASLTLEFIGISIYVYGSVAVPYAQNRCNAVSNYAVDGSWVGSFETASSTTWKNGVQFWNKTGLPNIAHQLIINVTEASQYCPFELDELLYATNSLSVQSSTSSQPSSSSSASQSLEFLSRSPPSQSLSSSQTSSSEPSSSTSSFRRGQSTTLVNGQTASSSSVTTTASQGSSSGAATARTATGSSISIGAAVCGVVGGLVILVVLLALFFLRRRRKLGIRPSYTIEALQHIESGYDGGGGTSSTSLPTYSQSQMAETGLSSSNEGGPAPLSWQVAASDANHSRPSLNTASRDASVVMPFKNSGFLAASSSSAPGHTPLATERPAQLSSRGVHGGSASRKQVNKVMASARPPRRHHAPYCVNVDSDVRFASVHAPTCGQNLSLDLPPEYSAY